ncbi:hypothetical protein [Candidatus Aquicultor sp.]
MPSQQQTGDCQARSERHVGIHKIRKIHALKRGFFDGIGRHVAGQVRNCGDFDLWRRTTADYIDNTEGSSQPAAIRWFEFRPSGHVNVGVIHQV